MRYAAWASRWIGDHLSAHDTTFYALKSLVGLFILAIREHCAIILQGGVIFLSPPGRNTKKIGVTAGRRATEEIGTLFKAR